MKILSAMKKLFKPKEKEERKSIFDYQEFEDIGIKLIEIRKYPTKYRPLDSKELRHYPADDALWIPCEFGTDIVFSFIATPNDRYMVNVPKGYKHVDIKSLADVLTDLIICKKQFFLITK